MGNIRSRTRNNNWATRLEIESQVRQYNSHRNWRRLSSRLRNLLEPESRSRFQLERLNLFSVHVLKYAAAFGFTELIAELLDGGLDIDATVDDEGNTLLHVAVRSGRRGLVRLLLVRAARIDISNAHGRTPVSLVIQMNNPMLLTMFQEYEAARHYENGVARACGGTPDVARR